MSSFSFSKTIIFTAILSVLGSGIFAQSVTFNFTGAMQTYIVPSGVTSVAVDVQGACGGPTFKSRGGYGGRVQCTLGVTAGAVLYLCIGGVGEGDIVKGSVGKGGYNGGGYGSEDGGGGGGATDIRYGGVALSNRIVVAGGGGGGCGPTSIVSKDFDRGGNGGGLLGETGYHSAQQTYEYNNYAGSGGAAAAPIFHNARKGDAGAGGNAHAEYVGGGGGGGGYFGGTGGDENGGGGGSSYSDPVLANSVVHTQGFNTTGNGRIVITPVYKDTDN